TACTRPPCLPGSRRTSRTASTAASRGPRRPAKGAPCRSPAPPGARRAGRPQAPAGRGLPAPDGSPAADAGLSPALSQIVTEPGPIAGRKIGIIADAGSDLPGVARVRKAAAKLGATALV